MSDEVFPARILVKRRFSVSDIQTEVVEEQWNATPEYEEAVQKAWQERANELLAKNIHVWDGVHYRLMNTKELEQAPKVLTLRLGTIFHRYVGTFLALKSLYAQSNLPPLYHLSTAAIIRTCDGQYLFGKRSLNGHVDLIGGGLQSDELVVHSGEDIQENMFKEMREEVGVSKEDVQDMVGIGILESNTSNILIITEVNLKLTKAEVIVAFTNREDEEMAEPVFVSESELVPFLRKMSSYRNLIPDLLDTTIKSL